MSFELVAERLKAVADPTRLRIVALLRDRDFCICELVPYFNISQPAVSKHMQRLRAAKLVTEQRKGQWVFYSLAEELPASIQQLVNELPDLSQEIDALQQKGLLVCCD